MSTRLTNEKYLTYVKDNEDYIVHGLSSVDLKLFIENLCQRANTAYSKFSNLEVESIEVQVLIRYILRVFSENLRSEASTWDSFVQVVSSLDGCSVQLVDQLKCINKEQNEFAMSGLDLIDRDSKEDITFKVGDANILAEVLVEASPKWELIAISLCLKDHERENCKNNDVKLCLYNVINCWLKNYPDRTMTRLEKSLASKVVGETNLSLELKRKFKQAAKLLEKNSLTSPEKAQNLAMFKQNPVITGMSNDSVQVAEGKSTLLLVKAIPKRSVSYQWKKNEIAIEDCSHYTGVHSDMLVISKACRGTEGEYTCCVTYQEKEVCSEKITVKTLFQLGKKKLLDVYLSKNEIPNSHDTWPPKVSKEFINLGLIISPEDSKYSHDYSVRGDIDDIKAKKSKVKYEEVFKVSSSELIMLEGRPGSGKTTLVHKIVNDWANGKTLHGAQLVFLVVLRELNNTQVHSLSDLLKMFYYDEELKSVCQFIHDSNGENSVFVIDGLDEYRCQDKESNVINQLLDKKLLPLAMIIVSSRPSASKSVREDVLSKRIEVFGFSENEILEYIDHFPFSSSSSECSNTTSSQSAQDSLKEYVHSHPNVMDMCYLPVHCAMICYLYDSESVSQLSTQTRIYKEFTRSLILRHLRTKHPQISLNSLQELKGEFQEYFNNICKLAYYMTVNSNQIITSDEVASYLGCKETFNDSNCLGLLTIYHEIENTGNTKKISFLHLTLQEFLAAYYIAHLSTSKQVKNNKEHSRLIDMKTVWIFCCGLLSFQPGMKQLKEIFLIKEQYYSMDSKVSRIKYAFESQSQIVCDKVTKQIDGCFNLKWTILTPSDLLALSYVICNTTMPVKELHIGELPNDDNKLNILLKNISKINLCHLNTLVIDTSISIVGFDYLIQILKSESLKRLEFKLKNISCEQCQLLVDSLNSLNNLFWVSLSLSSTPDSIETLFKALSNSSLIIYVFNIIFTDITNEGVKALARGLTADIRLRELTFENSCARNEDLTPATSESDDANPSTTCQSMNTITSEGAASLASSFKHLEYLHKLDLSHNDIGIDGVKCLSSSIHFLTGLRELILSHNNIGSEGATSLFSSFHGLSELTELDLSHNIICSERAIGFSISFQYPYALENLDLSHNSISSEGATSLFSSFHCLSELKELNLSNNSISFEGATGLFSSFHCLSELKELNLSNNSISSEGATGLSILFQYLSGLKILDLSHNMVGSEGVISLSSSFQHISQVWKLNLSHNNIGYEGIQHLARNLSFLTHLRFFDVSYNDIDLEGALLILSNLKKCHELIRTYISQRANKISLGDIVVHDIITRDDVTAIEKLKEASTGEKQKRRLDLGFEVFDISPSKKKWLIF